MDLLSAQDWGDIRAALTDVKDTFLEHPVILRRRAARKLANFNESRESNLISVDYPLVGLKVAKKTDDEAKATEEPKGSLDISEGDLYFDYQKLLAHNPPLIVSTMPQIIPNQDSLIMGGVEHTIIGVNNVGPTEADFQLVKVHYKQQMQR
jgi:hypothetical protein